MGAINPEYWFVFPCAVLVALAANASGFSGGVLFQPFFNFVLRLPLGQSIATGIATETIGISSGAYRYWRMKQIDGRAVMKALPAIIAGVFAGLFVFCYAPRVLLRNRFALAFLTSRHQVGPTVTRTERRTSKWPRRR